MKTSLAHLPEKKQHQVRALGELIREEAEVEMVILFGSFARGDWVEDPVGGYFSDRWFFARSVGTSQNS